MLLTLHTKAQSVLETGCSQGALNPHIFLVVHSTVSLSEGGWEALQASGHPLLISKAVNGYRLGRSSEPSWVARVPATLRMSTLSSLQPTALLLTATEVHVPLWFG